MRRVAAHSAIRENSGMCTCGTSSSGSLHAGLHLTSRSVRWAGAWGAARAGSAHCLAGIGSSSSLISYPYMTRTVSRQDFRGGALCFPCVGAGYAQDLPPSATGCTPSTSCTLWGGRC